MAVVHAAWVANSKWSQKVNKKEVPLSVKRTAIGHAKQTLTLFKEGVPEGGGSFCGAAWVAEKCALPKGSKTKKKYPFSN